MEPGTRNRTTASFGFRAVSGDGLGLQVDSWCWDWDLTLAY